MAAGTIAFLLPRLAAALSARAGGARPGAADGRPRASWPGGPSPAGLQALLFGAVALYALQAAYSVDHAKAAENILAFYVPFALLFLLLQRRAAGTGCCCSDASAWRSRSRSIFAGIGFVEYSRKSLFLNPKVVAANQYDNYFRVNSLFFDPNIYGRFLALVMIARHDRRAVERAPPRHPRLRRSARLAARAG